MLNSYNLAAFRSFDKFGQKTKQNKKTKQKKDTTTLQSFRYFVLFRLYRVSLRNLTQHIHKRTIRNSISSFIFLNIEKKMLSSLSILKPDFHIITPIARNSAQAIRAILWKQYGNFGDDRRDRGDHDHPRSPG